MIPNKTPFFEKNYSFSEFVPTAPTENLALQNSEVPNMKYDGATLQDMRDNSVLYDHNFDGLDKQSIVTETLRNEMPKVAETAERMKLAKAKAQPKRL